MSALSMTLNTTAETETAKIARGLRERDMELLADLVERAVSIDWCATCYTSPGGESMRRTLRRRPGFACCNGAASTTGGSGLIHGYSRSPAIWQSITSGKNEKRWQQDPCQMIAMQCCCYPLPILPHSTPRPEAKTQCVWPAGCRFCRRCIARLCC